MKSDQILDPFLVLQSVGEALLVQPPEKLNANHTPFAALLLSGPLRLPAVDPTAQPSQLAF